MKKRCDEIVLSDRVDAELMCSSTQRGPGVRGKSASRLLYADHDRPVEVSAPVSSAE